MNNQKIETIRWLVEIIMEIPGRYIWLATSGSVITGRPITPAEYYQQLLKKPVVQAHTENNNILALADVQIIQNTKTPPQVFEVALVDLELIVAWGGYNSATTYFKA